MVIIGAGFSGLASAALLANKGFDVLVLEKNSAPGGRALVYEHDGFKFDMGPSWYLMPDIFERFFQVFGKLPEDFYELKRLDPSYRVFFGPNDWVDISSNFEKNLDLFEHIESGAAEKLREYVGIASYQYKAAVDEFLYKDYRKLSDFFNRRTLIEGRKLRVFESIDHYARRYFRSEKLRRILEYSVVFLGSSPSNTPAMYSMLSHVDFNLGVWYPVGGMGSVVKALQNLAESQGACILFDHEAKSLDISDRQVRSVTTSLGSFPADVILVSADYAHSEMCLIDSQYRSYGHKYWQKRVLAPSALLIYLGLSKRIPKISHHTLSFQHDWVGHFESIFESPAWPENPSYYVCCPSKSDDSVAPPGCENVVLLVPIASGLEDNDDMREQMAELVIGYFEQIIGESVRDNIVCRTVFSQRDFAKVFNAYRGTALGLSHTLLQT
ncbi:MAG: phytoene desaturase family protein, partial [Armatimonadetes bacterium]|nr:phytoene desaturase family protein [Armatimonadota bacterium]